MSSTDDVVTEEVAESLTVIEIRSQDDRKEDEIPAEKATCTICMKEVQDKFISCKDCGACLHYRCTFLPAYQLFYFINDISNYVCVNCTPEGLLEHSSHGVDILIKDIQHHLVELESVNKLLQKENEELRGEYIKNKNSFKVEKDNYKNQINDLQREIKNNQQKLSEANRKTAEKIKEVNKIKRKMGNDDIESTPNLVNVSIDENMNLRWNKPPNDTDRFINDFIEFKEFVSNELQNVRHLIANVASSKKVVKNKNIMTNKNDPNDLYWKTITRNIERNKENEQNHSMELRNSYSLLEHPENSTAEIESRTEQNYDNLRTPINPRNNIPQRRPDVAITENYILSQQRQEQQRPLRVVPGHRRYSSMARYGKKVCLIGDSHVKRIKKNDLNEHLKSGKTYVNCFSGATTERLDYYIVPTLKEDKPDVVVIQVGCNDVTHDTLHDINVHQIANKIVDIGKKCLNYGVKEVIISSIFLKKQIKLTRLIRQINDILVQLCRENNFHFICNDNINAADLWKDGVHLNDEGKSKYVCNLVDFLNNFINTGNI